MPFDLLFFYNSCPQQLSDRLLKVGDGVVSCFKWHVTLTFAPFLSMI